MGDSAIGYEPSPHVRLRSSGRPWRSISRRGGELLETLQPFSEDEYADRLREVRRWMHLRSVDALVLSEAESLAYLSGYETPGPSFACAVVLPDECTIVARELEASNARYCCTTPYLAYGEGSPPEAIVATLLARCARVGFEADSSRLTVRQHELLLQATRWVTWEDCSQLVLGLRSIKSAQEIAYAQQAAIALATAVGAGVRAVRAGVTELAIAGEIQLSLAMAGSEWPSYPVFVSAGHAGCIGHHAASRGVVADGDVVFMEVAACYNRYHVARMHTVYVGTPPEWYVDLEQRLTRALRAGQHASRPGANASAVDRAMRKELDDCAIPHWMASRSGYAIGLGVSPDWKESNCLIDGNSVHVLSERMLLHLIPWVQIPHIGSMGFSRTIIVTPNGGMALI